jgi:hypothetical protein
VTTCLRRRLAFGFAAVLAACGGASGSDLIGNSSDDGGTDDGGGTIDGSTGPATDGSTSGPDGSSPTDGGITPKDSGSKDAGHDANDSGLVDAGCGDLTASNANCGACGYACVHGRNCVASRCAPAWQTITQVGEPTPRTGHAAAAVGGKFYVMGGGDSSSAAALDNGGIYDPAGDSWDTTLPSMKKARCNHAAVSDGTKIYTYGGITTCNDTTSTGPALEVFDPAMGANGQWNENNKGGAPDPRSTFPGVWTGTSMFVFGGTTSSAAAVASGAQFTPGTGWTDTSCALALCQRGGFFGGFVDGTVVRYFGGSGGSAPAGLMYDLAMNKWSAWAAPITTPIVAHRTADQGRLFVVLEAAAITCPHSVNVRIYDKKSGTWTKDTAASPAGLNADAATAWIGSELFAWSGDCGQGASMVGARYQPPAP